jgi:ankyrin repeat protein
MLEVVQILLVVGGEKGQGLETTDDRWETALHCAARGGNKEVVVFLLKKGVQTSSGNENGATPLMVACLGGHLEVTQILFDATEGQGLEERDSNGETVLSYAASGGNIEVVAYLLSKGAQASSRDDDGKTPFMWACKVGEVEAAQMLFDATQGQGLEDQDNDGCTALHHAASEGHKEVVAFLLSKGVDTNSRSEGGFTPLLCACEAGDLELVQMVLTATEGKGLEDRDHRGGTVLHSAAYTGTKELMGFLLSKGVQADIKNNKMETALMRACWYGNQEVIQLLLKHTGGQGVNETNSEGRTALHLAMAIRRPAASELVRVLVLAGADPDTADNEGRTPRQLADRTARLTACVEAFKVSLHVPGRRWRSVVVCGGPLPMCTSRYCNSGITET